MDRTNLLSSSATRGNEEGQMNPCSRRSFLASLAVVPAVSLVLRAPLLAAAEKGMVKIRDIKALILEGTRATGGTLAPDEGATFGPRTYTLVKVESDS